MTATTGLTCPACGATAVEGDRFCEACGSDLGLSAPAAVPRSADAMPTCPSCGAAAGADGDGYCRECGIRLPAARDHTEVALDGVAAVSDRGKVHPRNEDAYALAADTVVAVVVCDGVSTTVNPDVASQAAATAALSTLTTSASNPPERLLDAFVVARDAVQHVEGEPQPPSLGWPSCTFLAALVDGPVVDLATMGDCRSYWLPASGDAIVLTEDDSWAAEQIESGAMTAVDAYADPSAHTITRWIGRDADSAWRPRLLQFTAPDRGRLVLCSDGLWNYAERAVDVAAAAGAHDDPPIDVARRLTTFACEQGGHDNITVVIVDLPYAKKGSG